jgi:hypothetical protein
MNPTELNADQMSPAEWLASIRSKYGLESKFSFPDSWLENLLNNLPSQDRGPANKIWLERRSRSISDVHDEMMNEYLVQVLPVLNHEETRVAESVFFGVLPTYTFDAYSGRTPKGDRIVILHHATPATLAFWSHWYLRLKDEGGRDYFADRPHDLVDALLYVARLWVGQPATGKYPDIYPKTEDSWHLDQCLVLAAITFVIGHELGHVLKDHGAYSLSRKQNHAMELDADRIGLSIVIRQALAKTAALKGDTYHAKFMLFGPLFVLAVLSLIDGRASDTHPSPARRRVELLKAYSAELERFLGARYYQFMDFIDDDLFQVLTRNSDRLFELFGVYRELLKDLTSMIEKPDAPWLKQELASLGDTG